MANTQLSIGIHGAAGRMGRRLVALAAGDPTLRLTCTLENPAHPSFGKDAGGLAGVGSLGIVLGNSIAAGTQAIIDFSVPSAVPGIANLCAAQGVPLVVATTGCEPEHVEQLKGCSNTIPILFAPSMSLAVNVAMKLTGIAAAALAEQPGGVDVEIIERHHRFKEDAPSGTALKFGAIIQKAMGQTQQAHGRQGRPGHRPQNEIGYHAVRVGDNPGEHTIVFGLLGETLELVVRATDRDCYVRGAFAAARFLVQQNPGWYSMNDVLGL